MSEASQLDSATDHIVQGMFNQHDILKMKRLAAQQFGRGAVGQGAGSIAGEGRRGVFVHC